MFCVLMFPQVCLFIKYSFMIRHMVVFINILFTFSILEIAFYSYMHFVCFLFHFFHWQPQLHIAFSRVFLTKRPIHLHIVVSAQLVLLAVWQPFLSHLCIGVLQVLHLTGKYCPQACRQGSGLIALRHFLPRQIVIRYEIIKVCAI